MKSNLFLSVFCFLAQLYSLYGRPLLVPLLNDEIAIDITYIYVRNQTKLGTNCFLDKEGFLMPCYVIATCPEGRTNGRHLYPGYTIENECSSGRNVTLGCDYYQAVHEKNCGVEALTTYALQAEKNNVYRFKQEYAAFNKIVQSDLVTIKANIANLENEQAKANHLATWLAPFIGAFSIVISAMITGYCVHRAAKVKVGQNGYNPVSQQDENQGTANGTPHTVAPNPQQLKPQAPTNSNPKPQQPQNGMPNATTQANNSQVSVSQHVTTASSNGNTAARRASF